MEERHFIQCDINDTVTTLTIDNPPVNALTLEAVQELGHAVQESADNDKVKVIIVTGAGEKAFCAGTDIKPLATLTQASARALAAGGKKALDQIDQCPKPVIAAINGICAGGGLEVALACHIRIAADTARLGLPEINIASIPGWGGTQRLPRAVGDGKALELMLTGELITADESLSIGLVQKVIPHAELSDTAESLARSLSTKAQLTLRAILRAAREGANRSPEAGMDLETELFTQVSETFNMKEGAVAFLEKRPPTYRDC